MPRATHHARARDRVGTRALSCASACRLILARAARAHSVANARVMGGARHADRGLSRSKAMQRKRACSSLHRHSRISALEIPVKADMEALWMFNLNMYISYGHCFSEIGSQAEFAKPEMRGRKPDFGVPLSGGLLLHNPSAWYTIIFRSWCT